MDQNDWIFVFTAAGLVLALVAVVRDHFADQSQKDLAISIAKEQAEREDAQRTEDRKRIEEIEAAMAPSIFVGVMQSDGTFSESIAVTLPAGSEEWRSDDQIVSDARDERDRLVSLAPKDSIEPQDFERYKKKVGAYISQWYDAAIYRRWRYACWPFYFQARVVNTGISTLGNVKVVISLPLVSFWLNENELDARRLEGLEAEHTVATPPEVPKPKRPATVADFLEINPNLLSHNLFRNIGDMYVPGLAEIAHNQPMFTVGSKTNFEDSEITLTIGELTPGEAWISDRMLFYFAPMNDQQIPLPYQVLLRDHSPLEGQLLIEFTPLSDPR